MIGGETLVARRTSRFLAKQDYSRYRQRCQVKSGRDAGGIDRYPHGLLFLL